MEVLENASGHLFYVTPMTSTEKHDRPRKTPHASGFSSSDNEMFFFSRLQDVAR